MNPHNTSTADSERQDNEHHTQLFRDGRDSTLPAHHPVNAFGAWKKFAILCTLTYCGFLANFSVAIIQVAFPPMAKTFGVAVPKIPNSIGYNLLGFAVGPLFWNPLSKTIGRRPVYLIGSLLFLPCAVWMALSPTYVSFCIARVFAGLASSWSQTVPPSTIADIFVKQVRGSKISMYAVAVVVAPAIAPVFCGLVVTYHSWRVLFWIILGMGGLQLALFFFLVPETLWNEEQSALHGHHEMALGKNTPPQAGSHLEGESDVKRDDVQVDYPVAATSNGRVGPAWYPWQRPGEYLKIFISPILMLRYIVITVPSIYYGMVFAWSVGITIVMPQKFEAAPYNFKTIPLGAAFLAFGIGGVLGKWSGGIVGDKTVTYFEKKKGQRQPEHRLYALLPILPFMFVGCLIVGITIVKQLHWIAYLMGGGLFFFCLSAATGLLQTYVLETYITRAQDTQAVFVFWKSMWGFAIAFFVYEWGTEHGFLEEYLIQGALATGVGFLLTIGLIAKGHSVRKWQGMPVTGQ